MTFVTRDKRESLHVKHGVNRPREAVMTPAEEELREERRMGTGVTGQENLSPSSLVLFPPPPVIPPLHPAVPVLTATSHTLHLPSGSGHQRKGQLADS